MNHEMTKVHVQSNANPKEKNYALFICILLATGGLMFGYDNSVISGAIGSITARFQLDAANVGWVVSCITIGAVGGSLAGGVLSDHFGRKKILLLAALCFVVSSIGQGMANGVHSLVLFRILGGVGIGIANTVTPLYIAEIAPARIRGALTATYQLIIVVGITAVFFVNAYVASMGNEQWNHEIGWRIMLCLGAVPAFIYFLSSLFVPESPRWLRRKGEAERSIEIIRKIRRPEEVEQEMKEIDENIAANQRMEGVSFLDLCRPGVRKIVGVGFLLAGLQHLTGIDGILYYAPEIFKQAGAGAQLALYMTVVIGVVLTLSTLAAIFTVDKFGRKKLLLAGTTMMAVSLGFVGLLFTTENPPINWLLILILVNIAGFSIGLGSVMWVVLGEIFPTEIRGLAMSLSMFALWGANYLVAQFFPMIVEKFGVSMVFFIFCAFSVFTIWFIWRYIPETKGKTLEEIEKELWKNERRAVHS